MADSYIIDVIVDLQNDFVDGALGTPEARAMIGRAAAEARRAAEALRRMGLDRGAALELIGRLWDEGEEET